MNGTLALNLQPQAELRKYPSQVRSFPPFHPLHVSSRDRARFGKTGGLIIIRCVLCFLLFSISPIAQ